MASNIILVLDKIEGETKDSDYASENGIDLGSFSWSGSRGATTGMGKGRSEGIARLSNISLSKSMDKSSVNLMKFMCEAGNLKGTLYFLKSAGDDTKFAYFKIEMTDVMIADYSISASAEGGTPMESFSLAFEEFKEIYTQQNDDQTEGTAIEFAWNVGSGKNA
jgi:type VI secretion system secreted protein Hcp